MKLYMDELQTGQAIYQVMQTISTSIYFDRVPRAATFPYAVFSFDTAFQKENSNTKFVMSVNCWDNKGNAITDLLELTRKIKAGLHRLTCSNDNVFMYFTLESTLIIPEIEEQLRRRELRFNVELYNKEV